MKNLFKLSMVSAIAGILLSSCGSNWSVTKRHFNDGYYISHNKNKKSEAVNESEKTAPVKTNNTVEADQQYAKQDAVVESSNQNQTVGNNSVIKNDTKEQGRTIASTSAKKTSSFKEASIQGQIIKLDRSILQLKKKNLGSKDGEGHSLFWIIVLVLLILWALGVLSAGFVLMSLINLVLLVALILLILWLLRIV